MSFTQEEILAKITKYKTILEGLETCYANIQATGDIQQYSFNDGQSQINTTYRDPQSILKAIESTEAILERWQNKLDGRVTILRDADTLPRY